MYVIIAGGGRVGATLARSLSEAGHEVLIIERVERRCAVLRERLGSIVLRGDGCEAPVLAEAGAERADLFIAVTQTDEDNLIACQVALHRFHVRHAIGRVNNPRNEKLFQTLGVTPASAVGAIVMSVLARLPQRAEAPLASFPDGSVLLRVAIPDSAQVIGRRVTKVDLPDGASIVLIAHRDAAPSAPSWAVTLAAGDEALVLAPKGSEQAVIEALRS